MIIQNIDTDAFGINDESAMYEVIAGKMRKKRRLLSSVYSSIETKDTETPVIHVDDAYAETQIAAAKCEPKELELIP